MLWDFLQAPSVGLHDFPERDLKCGPLWCGWFRRVFEWLYRDSELGAILLLMVNILHDLI